MCLVSLGRYLVTSRFSHKTAVGMFLLAFISVN